MRVYVLELPRHRCYRVWPMKQKVTWSFIVIVMLCCNWIHYLVTGIQHSSRNTPPKTNHKLNYCKQEEIRRGNYCLQALLLASPNWTIVIINLVNRRCYSNYSILQDATVTISTGVIECVARCYSNQMLQVDTPRYYKQVHPTRREFRQESVPHTLFIQASWT